MITGRVKAKDLGIKNQRRLRREISRIENGEILNQIAKATVVKLDMNHTSPIILLLVFSIKNMLILSVLIVLKIKIVFMSDI